MILSRKIFIVDDDPDDRAMFCEALEEAAPDYICYTATNGRKALTALDNKEIDAPDLIFLDVNMPLMDGWQCLSILKEKEAYKHIPIIMYSTTSHKDEVRKARQLGALCVYTKPSDFTQLKSSLKLVIEHFHSNSLISLVKSSPLFLTDSQ